MNKTEELLQMANQTLSTKEETPVAPAPAKSNAAVPTGTAAGPAPAAAKPTPPPGGVQQPAAGAVATGQNLAQPTLAKAASHNVTMPISARVQGHHEKGM